MIAPRTRPEWCWFLPVVLLIGVACCQILLAHTVDLTPWSGGGFGMFSTTDGRGNRHLHAFALRPGIRRELALSRDVRDQVRRVLTLPTVSRIHTLADTLAKLPSPDFGPLQAIEIQIWRTAFDPHTLEPSSALLRSFEVPFVDR